MMLTRLAAQAGNSNRVCSAGSSGPSAACLQPGEFSGGFTEWAEREKECKKGGGNDGSGFQIFDWLLSALFTLSLIITCLAVVPLFLGALMWQRFLNTVNHAVNHQIES
jgi:hypothetical protein